MTVRQLFRSVALGGDVSRSYTPIIPGLLWLLVAISFAVVSNIVG